VQAISREWETGNTDTINSVNTSGVGEAFYSTSDKSL